MINRRAALRLSGLAAGSLGLAACSADHEAAGTSHTALPANDHLIYVIRHAEKQEGNHAPFGVNTDGVPKSTSLTTRGWSRAGALITLFTSGRRGIEVPQRLIAAKPDQSSHRPSETISPLAQKMGLPLDLSITHPDVRALADKVRDLTGVTLIAWEHTVIPDFATSLGTVTPTPPTKWPGDCFDVVWVFRRKAGASTWQFSQIPQLLLGGDQDRVI